MQRGSVLRIRGRPELHPDCIGPNEREPLLVAPLCTAGIESGPLALGRRPGAPASQPSSADEQGVTLLGLHAGSRDRVAQLIDSDTALAGTIALVQVDEDRASRDRPGLVDSAPRGTNTG